MAAPRKRTTYIGASTNTSRLVSAAPTRNRSAANKAQINAFRRKSNGGAGG